MKRKVVAVSRQKRKVVALSRQYEAALRKHLKQGPKAGLKPAGALGRRAVSLGLETLDLARIHEGVLAGLETSSNRDGIIARAESFFTEAITPIEKTHHTALKTNARLSQLNMTLGQRTTDLAASKRSLKEGIAGLKTAEEELRKVGKHYAKLLRESHLLHKHLRHLTHQILSGQETERKKISLELNDEIAQTLLAINVRLLALKEAAKGNTVDMKKEIASTQQMVKESFESIDRFACELDIHQQA